MGVSKFSKAGLKSLATVDHYVQKVKLTDPELSTALKTVGTTLRGLTDEVYPRHPDVLWELRLYIAGPAPTAETNYLSSYFHVRMPIDASWKFKSITIKQIITTVQYAATGSTLILDLQVAQTHGTLAFKSLFKSGNANKINIPVGIETVSSVNLAIDTLKDDDLIRLDVTQADPGCAGIEIHLQGIYSMTEAV